jgi:cell division protein ZapA (FtsZ GTPase activity inhibitor)
MPGEAVELEVGGHTYRVVSPVAEDRLHELAEVVDTKLRSLVQPGRPIPTQALLFAALALADEAEQERKRRLDVERRSKEMLERVLTRIDETLETCGTLEAHLNGAEAAPAPQPDA